MCQNACSSQRTIGLCILILTVGTCLTVEDELNNPTPVCPKACQCSHDLSALHCTDSFKLFGVDIAKMTKTLKLTRTFGGPILNQTFNNLVRLETLDASYCQINFIQNGAFSGLIGLTKLYLQGNNIQLLDEFLFKDNVHLEILDISRNHFHFLPDEPFRFLPSLKVLNVSYNHLVSARLAMRFQGTTALTVIDFSGNRIESLTADDFNTTRRWDITEGKYLNFSQCGLKFIEVDAINTLRNVSFLGLSYNTELEISNISAYLDASKNVNLKSLDMSYTNLSHKISLDKLTRENLGSLSLQDLNLAGNGFTDIVDGLLANLNLRKLDFSHNNLTAISSGIATLNNLQYLDLSYNAISTVSEKFKDNIGKLEVLKLSNNLLADGCNLKLEAATALQHIDFSSNKFVSFAIPRELKKLRTVNLANNLIENVNNDEPLIGLKDLLELDMSNNRITSMNAFLFLNSAQIRYASFSGNQISKFHHQTFQPHCPKILNLSKNLLEIIHHFGWNHLDLLDLSDNTINEIQTQAFFFLGDLKALNLGQNNLSNLNVDVFSHLTNLTVLRLYGNSLSEHVPIPDVLAPLESLQVLDLSSNNFKNFDYTPPPFSKNFELREVKISHNHLSTLSPYVFSGLNNLQTVDFSHNPFHCECNNVPLQTWSLKTKVNIVNQENFGYICRSPNTRARMTLMTYSVRAYECNRYLFYIVTFSAAGVTAMGIAAVTATICYLCKRKNIGTLDINSGDIDLMGYKKISKTFKDDAVTSNDFMKRFKENYLKQSPSDTLIDVEFEKQNLFAEPFHGIAEEKLTDVHSVNGEIVSVKPHATKADKSKKPGLDVKKLKRYAEIYEQMQKSCEQSKNSHFKNKDKITLEKVLEVLDKDCKKKKDKDSLEKFVDAMEKEYMKIQERKKVKKKFRKHKKKSSKSKHEEVPKRPSRGNKDLVRMLSMRQARNFPDVLSYVNSLPRMRHGDHEYKRMPIYHIDYIDEGRHGWARSMVDIPKYRRLPGAIDGHVPSREQRRISDRYLIDVGVPHGYHTVAPGHRTILVNSRLADKRSKSISTFVGEENQIRGHYLDALDCGVEARRQVLDAAVDRERAIRELKSYETMAHANATVLVSDVPDGRPPSLEKSAVSDKHRTQWV